MFEFATTILPLIVMSAGAAAANDLPEWLDEVQTYSMLPVTPEEAKEMNVSVNGVWAGFGGSHPVLPFQQFVSSVNKEFGVDATGFAAASHEAGLVVCAAINGTEGFQTLREAYPEVNDFACRDADGKVVGWGGDPTCRLMCVNNPGWLQWQIDCGIKGIDCGADLVLVDSPQSCAIAFGHSGAGFCDACLENFKRHLYNSYSPEELKSKFGLDAFDKQEIIARCRAPKDPQGDEMLYRNRAKQDPLYGEFFRCQEKASFDTRKSLIDALRDYAKSKERKVAFSGNAFHLGTVNPYGYWMQSFMFTDIFDLFTYEMSYSPQGFPHEDVPLPRGKWAPYHKLAHALRGRREVALIPAVSIGKVLDKLPDGDPKMSAWLGVLFAEAYAANGANTLYYFEYPPGTTTTKEKIWSKAIAVAGFVLDHKDLYEGDLESGSPLAILFLNNERGRNIPAVYPSYLGFAQALIEGNYPFDVVFGGDGKYVVDRLESKDLERYKAVIVPSPIAPTENQAQIVRDFLEQGGTLICQEPDLLGVSPDAVAFERVVKVAGNVEETWTNDVASNFYKEYDPALRQEVLELVSAAGLSPMLGGEANGLVSVFPILQPAKKRVVVHCVNYDIDPETDSVRGKQNLAVTIRMPLFMNGEAIQAELYAPGANSSRPLKVSHASNTLSCVVPELDMCASVVFSLAGAEDHASNQQ